MKPKATARGLLGGRSVLVIEPNLNYRNSMKSFLSNMKIGDCKFVSTVKEAQIALLTIEVGLFIVEWGLKDKNGIQFCREIKSQKRFQSTPFLLTSVENLRKDVILASEVGVDGYLLKPFSFEEFSDSVMSVIRVKREPSQTNRMLLDAQDLLNRDELAEAERIFLRVQDEAPHSARALHGLAQIAEKQGDTNRAIELLKQAHGLNPDYVEALRDLIELLQEKGPLLDVLEYARKAHNLSPENPKYTLILAKALLEKENFTESEQFFKKTVRLSPKLAQAYKGLGQLYLIQEDYESAMKNFEKSLDLDDQDVSTLNSLGTTYVKLGKFHDGITKYQTALRIKPNDARILFNLGYAKEKLHDIESARYFYKKALTLEPEFDKAKRRLAMLNEST